MTYMGCKSSHHPLHKQLQHVLNQKLTKHTHFTTSKSTFYTTSKNTLVKISKEIYHWQYILDSDKNISKHLYKPTKMFVQQSFMITIMPLYPDIDLYYFCIKYKITIDSAIQIANSLEDAIHFLHKYQISHLDIKPENIIILKDYSIRLIDFEHMSHWSQPFQLYGTIGFKPNTNITMKQADWYAFGKTIIHILSHITQLQYICFNVNTNSTYQPPDNTHPLLLKAIQHTKI